MLLRNIAPDQIDSVCSRSNPVDEETLAGARRIIDRVRLGGEKELELCAAEFDGWNPGKPLYFGPDDFAAALQRIPGEHRQLLERTAGRIRYFATQQLAGYRPVETENCGARMGQTWHPLSGAGCYVPGGRYPLVSSLLMTAVTARTAGVDTVWVACPVATDLMLAAAGICQVDGFLAAGGAHAIAAMAFGVGRVPAADVVVGPGNRWVTAAKQLVAGQVKIDMLAGPSELVVLADDSADPAVVAADLLAQAEHDSDARPILVTVSNEIAGLVERELARQLDSLPSAETARAALKNGFAVLVADIPAGIEVCQKIAPEHLELHIVDAKHLAQGISRCGCVFVGSGSGEVFGDYGAGPNHVLPTGGTARHASGLSVGTFLRSQTWLELDAGGTADELVDDALQLARLEGLIGHARSAEIRRAKTDGGKTL